MLHGAARALQTPVCPRLASYLICGSYISSRANASTLGSILIFSPPCRAPVPQLGLWNLPSLFVQLVISPDQAARICADYNLHNYIRGITDHTKRTFSSLAGGLGAKA